MFKYSILFKGEEGSLDLKAESSDSPSFSYSLKTSKELTKVLNRYVDFTMSPNAIFEKIGTFSFCEIKQASEKSEDSGLNSSSSDEVESNEDDKQDSTQGFQYNWSWGSNKSSSDDNPDSEEKVGD